VQRVVDSSRPGISGPPGVAGSFIVVEKSADALHKICGARRPVCMM